MSSEEWQRLQEVFDRARRLPREKRDAYLREACGADEQLLCEVRALLEVDGRVSGLEPPGHLS